ncbi:hypothetical protein MNBD_GAMMA13-344 [hydrothermal vent metagenome]|uniref:Porin domain-containing protein n=1 Tax=hydrothermal vent metagenome TaxID=652676 RepID=A0A3B0YZ91_9ZZZZ
MKTKHQFSALGAALAMVMAHSAQAVEFKWSGFLNMIGARANDSALYLHEEGNIDDNGSFEESTLGLNAIVTVNDKLSIAAQIANAPSDQTISFDWGYGTLNLAENWAVKAGRVKFPGYLVSEYVRVGYAYPWIRPPEVVYSINMAAPTMGLDAYDGGALHFSTFTDNFDYSAEIYGGGRSTEVMDFDKMYGLVLRANTDIVTLVADVNWSVLNNPSRLSPEMATIMADTSNQDMFTASAGVNADWNNLVLYAEYAFTQLDFLENPTSATSGTDTVDVIGWYTTLGYRFGNLMPHLTYQSLDNSNGGLSQTSWTAGLRYDLGSSTTVKLEWQRIEPESASSNASVPLLLKNQLGLFTNGAGVTPSDEVDMISVAVNFIF